jgi:hypothetical protein
MSLNQATLMLINILLFLVLGFLHVDSKASYLPVEDMITRKVVIVSVEPKRSSKSRDGRIEVLYNDKKIKLSTRLRANAFDGAWDILGREAIIMVRPGMKYRKDSYPSIAHLEIVGGKVILDYRKSYEKHMSFLKNYNSIRYFIQFLLVCFFIWFVMSMRQPISVTKLK